ncbi:MAG: shikimate kinase AroK [Cycloclasticus pugetii]|jgi:shikimate kinase|uniref:Shikimate kinase n=2 Tax=Cycloclasticus TaxID=34067 RepID=S5T4B8_9GAMM|nr:MULTISPECIES: shikimate kinase AroK [Cycloclasticus]AGS38404.1 Shikimate kinase [Cycloclasticus zancles 78-ME]ATI02128.1 shikimate kinase AroK [Cycloclasticus sp. PY97N]EPD13122.1 shikimate kinase [Cycloclasticus pugetii]MBV1897815.1 shikimate kinase AroK [Cycloclasticus sp.]MDF1830039.1 shikimate kinase AroK [Cycloclasticus pugetii]
MPEKNNIYLVGPMAAGKSTIGKLLARRLNKAFYDTDAEIIKCTGVEISLIFELEGEEGFRSRETDKLKLLSVLDGAIIATGGGIVLSEENRKVLTETGWVIYLQCSVEQQLSRTKFDTKRPLLQIDNPRKKLEELMRLRAPIYESIADIVVSTNKTSSKKVILSILEQLKKK